MATCMECKRTVDCCHCDKVFYRVKPYDWSLSARRSGTSYAIEECRVVANSRSKEDAERLVERLNEWRRLKRDNAILRSRLEARDTGKIALYRVENIVKDEVAKTRQSWSFCAGRANLNTLVSRIVTRLSWAMNKVED